MAKRFTPYPEYKTQERVQKRLWREKDINNALCFASPFTASKYDKNIALMLFLHPKFVPYIYDFPSDNTLSFNNKKAYFHVSYQKAHKQYSMSWEESKNRNIGSFLTKYSIHKVPKQELKSDNRFIMWESTIYNVFANIIYACLLEKALWWNNWIFQNHYTILVPSIKFDTRKHADLVIIQNTWWEEKLYFIDFTFFDPQSQKPEIMQKYQEKVKHCQTNKDNGECVNAIVLSFSWYSREIDNYMNQVIDEFAKGVMNLESIAISQKLCNHIKTEVAKLLDSDSNHPSLTQ